MNATYTSPDGDPRLWTSGDLSAGKGRLNQGMVYAIQSPFTGDLVYPPPRCCWRLAQRELKAALEGWGVPYKRGRLKDDEKRAELLAIPVEELEPASALLVDGDPEEARQAAEKLREHGPWPRVYFMKKGQGKPRLKRYLEDVKQGKVATTWWSDDEFDEHLDMGAVSWRHEESGHSQTGVKELDTLVGGMHGFATVKPLKLFEKVMQLWCPADGLILDPFAGSGTTGHAALELNAVTGAERRFILVEQGRPDKGDSYARSLTADRLQRVVTGEWKVGKREPLGGGYRFLKLDRRVDADALLSMEREELVDTLIASHFDSAARKRDALMNVPEDAGYKYLVAKNADNEGFFLIWNGKRGNTDFTEETYEACAKEAKKAGLANRYHVYARLYRFQTSNVVFYQIPDRILMDFGLDLRGEPYHDDDES